LGQKLLSPGLLIGRPSYRRSLQPEREHPALKKMKDWRLKPCGPKCGFLKIFAKLGGEIALTQFFFCQQKKTLKNAIMFGLYFLPSHMN
jgi:hypothetical protein